MRPGRTAAASSVMAILGGVTALVGREASGAEPTTLQCLTAHEDSVNLRKNHQLRAAAAKLAICSSRSCPREIRTECVGRVRGTDASIPTIVFEARDVDGTSLVSVKVKMDGELLAERLQGSALPVDPGEHTFTFEVTGRPSIEKRLLVLEGEKLRRERVQLEPITAPKPVGPPPATLLKAEALEQPRPRSAEKPPLGRARVLALVLSGAGVAATGVGIAYGLIAMSRRNEARTACSGQCSDQSGVDLWNRARSAGNVSTGAFVVGAAGIVSGLVVWLRAKPAADTAGGFHVSLGPGGLQVSGSW